MTEPRKSHTMSTQYLDHNAVCTLLRQQAATGTDTVLERAGEEAHAKEKEQAAEHAGALTAEYVALETACMMDTEQDRWTLQNPTGRTIYRGPEIQNLPSRPALDEGEITRVALPPDMEGRLLSQEECERIFEKMRVKSSDTENTEHTNLRGPEIQRHGPASGAPISVLREHLIAEGQRLGETYVMSSSFTRRDFLEGYRGTMKIYCKAGNYHIMWTEPGIVGFCLIEKLSDSTLRQLAHNDAVYKFEQKMVESGIKTRYGANAGLVKDLVDAGVRVGNRYHRQLHGADRYTLNLDGLGTLRIEVLIGHPPVMLWRGRDEEGFRLLPNLPKDTLRLLTDNRAVAHLASCLRQDFENRKPDDRHTHCFFVLGHDDCNAAKYTTDGQVGTVCVSDVKHPADSFYTFDTSPFAGESEMSVSTTVSGAAFAKNVGDFSQEITKASKSKANALDLLESQEAQEAGILPQCAVSEAVLGLGLRNKAGQSPRQYLEQFIVKALKPCVYKPMCDGTPTEPVQLVRTVHDSITVDTNNFAGYTQGDRVAARELRALIMAEPEPVEEAVETAYVVQMDRTCPYLSWHTEHPETLGKNEPHTTWRVLLQKALFFSDPKSAFAKAQQLPHDAFVSQIGLFKCGWIVTKVKIQENADG